MNDVVAYRESNEHAQSALAVREQVNRIQDVLRHVMKPDVHYGKVPGTDKPTLYKPGAEVLCMTFRIAVSYETEDLSTADCVRYRVRAIGTHQMTGIRMGEGMGECSTDEEKYRWRRTYIDKEFDATPETRRRIKYAQSQQGKVYENKQIRTEPADLANTVLKMAAKRAQVAMTLNVTAASDCFAQDLEDLPPGIVDDDDERRRKPGPNRPQSKSGKEKPADAAKDDEPASKGQIAYLVKELHGQDGKPAMDECLSMFRLKTLDDITLAQWKAIKAWMSDPATPPPESVKGP